DGGRTSADRRLRPPQRHGRLRSRGAAGWASRSVVGANRVSGLDRGWPHLPWNNYRLQLLLADAFGALSGHRGRRARLRDRRALERAAPYWFDRLRNGDDVRGLHPRACDRTLSRHERRLITV